LWISTLMTGWSWVSIRRLSACPRANRDRMRRSFHARCSAVVSRSPYLSARLTAVEPTSGHALWSARSSWHRGDPHCARVPAVIGRSGQWRVPIHAPSLAVLAKSLPRGPAWGLFVWDLQGVGLGLRATVDFAFARECLSRALPARP
jgi:hypothetical protein